jgi:very-short-patch-repair endonuclease
MPRGNLRRSFDRGFVRPHSRQERLKMAANPYRPFKLASRFRIRRQLLRPNPWWWVTHRRGVFRPKVGQDPLEARAVPKELIKGTLPERIVFRYLVEQLHMISGVDFDFQTSLSGGRLEMGGVVVDFTFQFLHIAIQVQGPTHNALARFRKDEEQRLFLEQMGYSVIFLDMDLIYNQPVFEDTMRQIFLRQGYARGGVHGNHEVDEGVNGQDSELERLLGLAEHIEFLFQKALTGMANEWQP